MYGVLAHGIPRRCAHLTEIPAPKTPKRNPDPAPAVLTEEKASKTTSYFPRSINFPFKYGHRPPVLGAGWRLFEAPLTIEAVSTTSFSGGAVAHVFAAHA
jgi:hypothetical protein